MFVFAGHQSVSGCVRWTSVCERFCGCWGNKLYPHFQAALLPLGNGGTQEGPPLQGRTWEPRGLTGERASRTWQQPPPEPDSGSKGPRVRFYDPSQARKETAVKRQLQLGGRESRLSNSAQNDQSGRGCNGRHGYHPSRQPNRHHQTGCRQWPGQRGEEKPPTGQQA